MSNLVRAVADIEEIENYVLVGQNGEIIAPDIKNRDDIASLVTHCNLGASRIREIIGFSRLEQLTFNRIDNRNFFIFPAVDSHLGIQKIAGVDSERLAKEITVIINDLGSIV